MINNKKIKYILIALLLFSLSFIFILIMGRTYTLKLDVKPIDINEIKVSNDKIKIVGKKIDNDKLYLTIKSVSKGKSFVEITGNEQYIYHKIYVHNFGIITCDNYFGDTEGDEGIPISIFILIIMILYDLIKKYKHNMNINICQHKNIVYLSAIIFLTFTAIFQLFEIFEYRGMFSFIKNINTLTNSFSMILLPVAFISSIFVTISNIKLIIKEGYNWRNMLGTMLGVFFCLLTMLPDFMYTFTYNSIFINIHNEKAVDLYIYMFIENSIYLVVAYLECILISTIILGIKAARHIPKFDKDYIIILGCMIMKDGSLTKLLKSRVDRAIEFRNMQKEKTGKDLIFIPSGGQGSDEVMSEAEAIRNYLIKQGIKNKNIIIENKSTSTIENITFSNDIVKRKNKNANVCFSTTNYHVFRAGAIASSMGLNIEGIGAKTKSYFWINAFIREFIANLYSEKSIHIKIIIILLIAVFLMSGIMYFANII